jgi:hypothetical protein
LAAAAVPAFLLQAAPAQSGASRPSDVGLGVRVGGFTFGLAGSARYWRTSKWGIELDVWRHCVETGTEDETFGVWQFAPMALVVLANRDLTEDIHVRPYAGAGLSLLRASSDHLLADESSTSGGIVLLGGAELVFRQLPNVSISGDVGFFQKGTFGGIDVGGAAVAVSAHLYFR